MKDIIIKLLGIFLIASLVGCNDDGVDDDGKSPAPKKAIDQRYLIQHPKPLEEEYKNTGLTLTALVMMVGIAGHVYVGRNKK